MLVSDAAPAAATAALTGVGNDGSRDCLFVGDDPAGVGAEVDHYDAITGEYLGEFVETSAGDLFSIRGLVFDKRGGPNADLLVVDQNAGLPMPGEVLRYGADGEFLGALVDADDSNAPFAPRGMVVGKNFTLYVADVGDESEGVLGRLATFDARTGEFLGDLVPCADYTHPFLPRGVVIGPDGDVYVSTLHSESGSGGSILRFSAKTGECLEVFVDSEACACGFSRPEGLVFGPDGNLYVTSSAVSGTGTNGIFIFDGETGDFLDVIDLQTSVATALLFGPGEDLYVPITGGAGTGEVRRYDVEAETYEVIVPAGTTLTRPFYLTFCNTDPATLAYEPRGSTCCPR